MWIKICANTNLQDAKLAAELGADALGFVFAPSTRRVTPEQVAAIVAELPAEIEKVGVFMTKDAAEIIRSVRTAGLTGVQLHGGFDLQLARSIRAELHDTVSITQTIHWKVDRSTNNADEIAAQLQAITLEPAIDRVLVDSKNPQGSGGTGISFDWTAARETLKRFQGKIVVAGGLRPENVEAAIDALAPWGVDVASGVEAEPGCKDPTRLQLFISNVRSSTLNRG